MSEYISREVVNHIMNCDKVENGFEIVEKIFSDPHFILDDLARVELIIELKKLEALRDIQNRLYELKHV